MGREQKQQYKNLYSAIHYYYGHLCQAGTAFTVGKFLELRELRMLANVTVLRDIKYKISRKTQEIPDVVNKHLDIFKLHNMDPQGVHFFYYFDELQWRAHFIETLLEVSPALHRCSTPATSCNCSPTSPSPSTSTPS